MKIHYHELQITGIPSFRVTYLRIYHAPNMHGQAELTGEIPIPDSRDFLMRGDEKNIIEIKAVSGDTEKKLFVGYITNISNSEEAGYCTMKIRAADSSYKQDIQKISRSYQNCNKTYDEILNEAYTDNGSVQVLAADQPIGAMILQIDETNWEFTKRMASRFNVPVISNITAPKPLVYLGRPIPSDKLELNTTSLQYVQSERAYQHLSANHLREGADDPMRQDFCQIRAQSYDYLYVGDIVKIGDQEYQVKTITADLYDGLMHMDYELVRPTGFIAPVKSNKTCSGRVLSARVQKVSKDMIQAHLFEIDEQYDASSTWWFPYSTAYSSSDGSGWYVMPEPGDFVRIMFPSENEADAFAASSINTSPTPQTREKSFKAPGGKELLLTDEGIYVICSHQKIFIDLSQSDGISIVSAKPIHIVSSEKVTIDTQKDVQIAADDKILLQSGASHICLTPDNINIAAETVVIS